MSNPFISLKKGQRIVYHSGHVPDGNNRKESEIMALAWRLFLDGKVRLFQRVLERGPVIDGQHRGLTKFEYIAEGC